MSRNLHYQLDNEAGKCQRVVRNLVYIGITSITWEYITFGQWRNRVFINNDDDDDDNFGTTFGVKLRDKVLKIVRIIITEGKLILSYSNLAFGYCIISYDSFFFLFFVCSYHFQRDTIVADRRRIEQCTWTQL